MRERLLEDLEQEYVERVQTEDNTHVAKMLELKERIAACLKPDWHDQGSDDSGTINGK